MPNATCLRNSQCYRTGTAQQMQEKDDADNANHGAPLFGDRCLHSCTPSTMNPSRSGWRSCLTNKPDDIVSGLRVRVPVGVSHPSPFPSRQCWLEWYRCGCAVVCGLVFTSKLAADHRRGRLCSSDGCSNPWVSMAHQLHYASNSPNELLSPVWLFVILRVPQTLPRHVTYR